MWRIAQQMRNGHGECAADVALIPKTNYFFFVFLNGWLRSHSNISSLHAFKCILLIINSSSSSSIDRQHEIKLNTNEPISTVRM